MIKFCNDEVFREDIIKILAKNIFDIANISIVRNWYNAFIGNFYLPNYNKKNYPCAPFVQDYMEIVKSGSPWVFNPQYYYGFDLPVWLGKDSFINNKGNYVKLKSTDVDSFSPISRKRIMIIAQDPRRSSSNSNRGELSIASPWGLHCPLTYKSHLSHARVYRWIIDPLLTRNDVDSIYVTDAYKWFETKLEGNTGIKKDYEEADKDSLNNVEVKSFPLNSSTSNAGANVFPKTLKDEIDAYKPDVIISLGGLANTTIGNISNHIDLPHPNKRGITKKEFEDLFKEKLNEILSKHNVSNSVSRDNTLLNLNEYLDDDFWKLVISKLPATIHVSDKDPHGKYIHVRLNGGSFRILAKIKVRTKTAEVSLEGVNIGDSGREYIDRKYVKKTGLSAIQGSQNKNTWYWPINRSYGNLNEGLATWFVKQIVLMHSYFEGVEWYNNK